VRLKGSERMCACASHFKFARVCVLRSLDSLSIIFDLVLKICQHSRAHVIFYCSTEMHQVCCTWTG
jgi:hypothetical protein